MPTETQAGTRTPFKSLLHGVMLFLASLVVVRFILEAVGTPIDITKFLSSGAAVFLVAIYLPAVAPLRGGMQKFRQLVLPALLISAWTVGWVILATIVSAVFRIQRSHFAGQSDYGNWGNLGHHVIDHLVEIGIYFVIVLVLMIMVHTLWRWPVTVAPGALLGAFVIMRYFLEALGAEPWRASAWSSSIAVLLAAFYLGGIGGRMGLTSNRQLLVPALVIGWAWRAWVFVASVLSALVPYYKTHFFDPSTGHVPARLAQSLVASAVEGFVAGLIVWGIAIWIARATRRAVPASA